MKAQHFFGKQWRQKSALIFTAVLSLALLQTGCQKASSGSRVPVIRELLVSKDSIQLKPSLEDSLLMGFAFEDGDADLNNAAVNLRNLLDSSEEVYHYNFPPLRTGDLNLTEGAKGNIVLGLSSGELLFQTEDTVRIKKVFRITITDDAGQESNPLTTDTITIIP